MDAPIEQTEREVRAIAMRGKWYAGHGAQVVHPVEMGSVGGSVVSTNEEVHCVRSTRAEGVGEGTTDPRGGGGRAEGVGVTDLVEADIALNVLRKLDSITWAQLAPRSTQGPQEAHLARRSTP